MSGRVFAKDAFSGCLQRPPRGSKEPVCPRRLKTARTVPASVGLRASSGGKTTVMAMMTSWEALNALT